MNREVCISHAQSYSYDIIECNSYHNEAPSSRSLGSNQDRGWETEHLNQNHYSFLRLDLGEEKFFNAITLGFDHNDPNSTPKSFRIEISYDNQVWTSLIREEDFEADTKGYHVWHTPLISTRYIKVLITEHHNHDGEYFSHLPSINIGINGTETIKASSELDRLWTKENLIDGRADYGWSTQLNPNNELQTIEIDLGAINHVNKVKLRSKDAVNHYFPKSFYFEYSKDGQIWYTIHDERGYEALRGTWYNWTFMPTNMRFFRLAITEGSQNEDGSYLSQIIEMELHGVGVSFDHSHPHEGITPYATTLHAGLIRLAKDGETSKSVALQASDSRIKEATIHRKGIVRLADDGEEAAHAVIQGNDKRLRDATESYKGIVQLAKDGESRPNLAVQSHDKRLQIATEKQSGVLKLCPAGEESGKHAVQGNDPRLRKATVSYPGIVRLAQDGEASANSVVQGNDHRLKRATVEQIGIVQYAKDGEDTAETAVQGNDKRLREATETYRGIVKLAKNGEESPQVVVQGNDKRLQKSTQQNHGIIRLAQHEEKAASLAVQADDPRLYDAREAKEHSHDYAPREHSFDDHNGLIWLEGDKSAAIQDTSPPQKGEAVIGASHKKSDAEATSDKAAIALAGVAAQSNKASFQSIGVLGHSSHTGVRGQALGSVSETETLGAGVAGHGRDCPGGRFQSRHNYALIAGAPYLEDGSPASGKGLYVTGETQIAGPLKLKQNNGAPLSGSMAYFFQADHHAPLQAGDIVRIHPQKSNTVIKTENPYDPAAVGVVTDESLLSFAPSATKKEVSRVYVALYGVAKIKVDPSFGDINPGDMLTSSKTAGHAMRAQIEQFNQLSAVIGKALESAKGKTTTINVLLSP